MMCVPSLPLGWHQSNRYKAELMQGNRKSFPYHPLSALTSGSVQNSEQDHHVDLFDKARIVGTCYSGYRMGEVWSWVILFPTAPTALSEF